MSEDFLPGPVVKTFTSDRARARVLLWLNLRLRLDIRKKFVTVKVVRHCNRLSREVVGAQSLECSRSSGMGL